MFLKLSQYWLRNIPKDFKAFILDSVWVRGNTVLSTLATLMMGCVLCVVLWQEQHNLSVLIWYAALIALVTARWILARHKVIWPVIFVEALIGILWVIIVLICFPSSPKGLQIFFALVVMGAGLSSALFAHRILPGVLAAIGFAIPVTAFQFALQGGDGLAFLVFVILAGWVSALGLAWYLHRAFLSRTILQFEKTQLLRSVESHVEQLDGLRKMEKQSRQLADTANAAKSRFLAHASHDLRQPLHAIGLLLATIPEKGQNKHTTHTLGRVKQSLDVLSDLFDSLLDVTLLDTGKVVVNMSVFPVSEILEQVIQDFSTTAKKNNVGLSMVPSSLIVRSDPVILRRMVQNLVSNAIVHSHNSRVLVGIRRCKKTLRIEVHDTGAGIAHADQKLIFDEFTKVATQKPKNDLPGLGLGLAIVQRLAKIIDAKITLKSTLGVGSIFRIENLMITTSDSIVPIKTFVKTGKQPSSTIRVAILDDDVEVLKATDNLVTKWGFLVDSYVNYDASTLRKPDIILCDYELLQSLNGIEVIAEIRKKYGRTIPAVLITANNTEALIKQAKTAHLSVLFKPVKPAQLRSVLLTALSDEV